MSWSSPPLGNPVTFTGEKNIQGAFGHPMPETLHSHATGLDTDLHGGSWYRATRQMYVFISGYKCLICQLVIPLLVESSTSFQPISHPAWIGMSPQGLKGRHAPLILNRERMKEGLRRQEKKASARAWVGLNRESS